MALIWKLALGALAAALLLYLAGVAWLYWNQRSLIYPAPDDGGGIAATPDPGSRAVQVRTADGLALRAIYRPAGAGRRTILFFHGNGDSLAGAQQATRLLAARGFGLLLLEYRGYAGNPGSPTEQGLYRDGAAALVWLASQGVAPERTVVIGNSLGSGIATELAMTNRLGALVLVSGFTSMPDAVQANVPFVPARWLVLDRYDNRRKLARVACPVLVLHAADDPLVSVRHARLLAEANPRAQLEIVPTAGHQLVYTDASQQKIADWLGRAIV